MKLIEILAVIIGMTVFGSISGNQLMKIHDKNVEIKKTYEEVNLKINLIKFFEKCFSEGGESDYEYCKKCFVELNELKQIGEFRMDKGILYVVNSGKVNFQYFVEK